MVPLLSMATTSALLRRHEHRSIIRTCQRLAQVAARPQRALPKGARRKHPRASAERPSLDKVFCSITSSQPSRAEVRTTIPAKRAPTSQLRSNLQPSKQLSWPPRNSRIRNRSSTRSLPRKKKESHRTSSTLASSRPTRPCRLSRTRSSTSSNSSITCSCSRCSSASHLSSSRSSWSSSAMSNRNNC